MKINLLPTLFAVVGVPLTFGLGIWQVQRHIQKMEAHRIVAERIDLPVLSNADLPKNLESDHWKLIELTGKFEDKTALIGGKMIQNQPGYNLIQLFTTDDGYQIMVERGWLPREDDKGDINDKFKEAMIGNEKAIVKGQLRPIRFHFEMEPIKAEDFPTLVWRPASQGEIHRRWLPENPPLYVVAGPVLREHQSKDLTRMPYSGFVPTPAEYNSLFYAIQWFLISAILFGIWVFMGRRKPESDTPAA